jgi:hypothetical protein
VYEWSQVAGPAIPATATSYDKIRLSFPPYTLITFATYTFSVAVASSDSTIAPASASVTYSCSFNADSADRRLAIPLAGV